MDYFSNEQETDRYRTKRKPCHASTTEIALNNIRDLLVAQDLR